MKRFLVLGLFTLACGAAPAEGGSPQLSSEELELRARVTDLLSTRGYDTRELLFIEDRQVVVEGDMIMKIDDILAFEHTSTPKGYLSPISSIVNTPALIYLVNSSTHPISPAWVWAFVTAAANWNDKTTNIVFTVSPPPLGHAKITLSKERLGPACSFAWTEAASGGSPGKRIIINSHLNCPAFSCAGTNIETVPADQALKTATHELGHALGFGHPEWEEPAVYIPFTSVGTTPLAYPSVMWSGCVGGNATSTISPDDELSAYVVGY